MSQVIETLNPAVKIELSGRRATLVIDGNAIVSAFDTTDTGACVSKLLLRYAQTDIRGALLVDHLQSLGAMSVENHS